MAAAKAPRLTQQIIAPLAPLLDGPVWPGDVVLTLSQVASACPGAPVRTGAALRQEGDALRATKRGRLRFSGGKLWVEVDVKRYLPAVEDAVLGVVVEKHAENFSVDVGGPFKATLSVLAFENASRRNRPNVGVGSLVFARVATAPRDAEPTLSCVDASGKSAGFGPQPEGLPFFVSTGAARRLLEAKRPAELRALGEALTFELTLGVNGRGLVQSASVREAILVASALQECASLGSEEERLALVKGLLKQHAEEGN